MFPFKKQKSFINMSLVVLMIALLSYSFSIFYNISSQYPANTLSVSAEGKIEAVPNIGLITFMISAKELDKASALENYKKNFAIVNADLKKYNDDQVEVKTENYNVYPNYVYSDKSEPTLSSYTIEQSLSLKVKDLDLINELLELLSKLPVMSVSNVNFVFDDVAVYDSLALEDAVNKANEKARIMTKLSGRKLGKIYSIYEDNYYEPEYGRVEKAEMMDMAESISVDDLSVEVNPGNKVITKKVTVTYKWR